MAFCLTDWLFTQISNCLFAASRISEAGHNTHLEQPETFLRVLLDFLQEIQRT
jgi:pimeloyl-ACP methyl ester carboxylesterase